jgi:hypothetical protein
MIPDKNLLGYLSLILTALSTAPYIWSMFRGEVRPHVFSWIIWTLACAIISAAQYAGQAGPGAWSAGFSALIALLVVCLCFLQKADWSITRSDWIAFTGALTIIPLWYITASTLIAAVLATLIDTIAYYPTFRKSYYKPHQEMAFLYFVANLKHIASIFAMNQYSVTTLIMPVVMLAINMALIIMLAWRRRVLALT